jgi:hypothetical protein
MPSAVTRYFSFDPAVEPANAKFYDHRLLSAPHVNSGLGQSTVLDLAGPYKDANGSCDHGFTSLKVTNVPSAAAAPISRIHPRAQ